MRAVVQRAVRAAVEVKAKLWGRFKAGCFRRSSRSDTEKDCRYLAEKIAGLRIFEDEQGKMNLFLQEGGAVLCVSQFTLLWDCRKAWRPCLSRRRTEKAIYFYDQLCEMLANKGLQVARGKFQAK